MQIMQGFRYEVRVGGSRTNRGSVESLLRFIQNSDREILENFSNISFISCYHNGFIEGKRNKASEKNYTIQQSIAKIYKIKTSSGD